MSVSRTRIQEFHRRLIAWGWKNERSFPWRCTHNPYWILVAEMMLHRTKARQVVPVYLSFIEKYSTPRALARAKLEKLKEEIASLGLKYRATRLKKIGKILVERYNGQVPSDLESLLELPGVGLYIANAVLCFAFGKSTHLLDTNIIRVVHRVFSIPITKNSYKKKEFWDFIGRIAPQDETRAFNLAILDLASLICLPKKPKHDKCPIKDICDFKQSRQERE